MQLFNALPIMTALAVATLLGFALWEPDPAPRASVELAVPRPLADALPGEPAQPPLHPGAPRRAAAPQPPLALRSSASSFDPPTQVDAPARVPLAAVASDSGAPVPEPDPTAN